MVGLLLTGGASRRLGTDKARLRLDGETLADRAARVLGAVCAEVVEVGPGHTALPNVREHPAGAGPLAALLAGAQERAADRVLLLAVDLPNVAVPLLDLLARWPGDTTVVPVADGRLQTVCARYGPRALVRAHELAARGEASLRALVEGEHDDVVRIDETIWGRAAAPDAFADVDDPADVARFGLEVPR